SWTPLPRRAPLFPYTTLFRSASGIRRQLDVPVKLLAPGQPGHDESAVAGRHPRSSLYIAEQPVPPRAVTEPVTFRAVRMPTDQRSEEHTSELQSRENLVCRLQ